MPTITLFSTLAVRKALDEGILAGFTDATGIRVDPTFDPTNVLLDHIEAGARPDVMIGVTAQLDPLGAAGVVDLSTRVPIATVGVGVAASPDVRVPDISSVDALVSALLAARSVAYSRTGASGVYFAALLDRLGIADEVNARATVVEKGFTALAVIDGRADLAIQQLSELVFVPEAVLVGPLPDAVQHHTEFAAVVGAAGAGAAGAGAPAPRDSRLEALAAGAAFVRYLAGAQSAAEFRATGLDPVSS